MNDVLRDFLDWFVFVYLDDILVFSCNPDKHVKRVRLVLQRLLEIKLFIKAKKCASSIQFLGHIFEKGQIKADPIKVKAVAD